MSDLRDGPQSAISAIRDVLMKNQDLKQQDLESRYGHYGKQPEPVEVPTEPVVDGMEEPVDVDPETVVAASGEESESGEEPAAE